MKYLLQVTFVAFLFLTMLPGCNKDNNDQLSSSYLKGKIDGVAFECTSNITANTPEPGPSGPADPTLRITGAWLSNSISLMIITENPGITSATYIFEVGKNRSGTIRLNTDAYYAGPGGFGSPVPMYGSGKIIISEISKNYVKGNFDFTNAPNTGVTKTITEGEFYVKRN